VINLREVICDMYVLAGLTDHTCSWRACRSAASLFGGRIEFVFNSSGQGQSLVCRPDPKAKSFTNYAPSRVGSRSLAIHDGGRGQPMSRRDEIQFTPEEQASFLSQPHKAALATIDKEGFPHVVAMGYRYKDGVIYMTSYGKAQKVVNVRRNPKVGVMVEVGERYADFRGIMIRGHCEVIEDPQVVKETMRLAGESATAAVPSGAVSSAPKRVVLKITPYRIASWDHTKLGGKY